MRNSWTGTLRRAFITVVLALSASVGCSCKSDWKLEWGAPDVAAKRGSFAPRQLVQAKARRNGAGLTLRPNREFWKSLRVEATLLLPDARHASLGQDGSFGVSLLEFGGIGRFYVINIRREGAGVVIEAGTGGAPISTLSVPDSLAVDVAFASVGGLISMEGRRHGDASFTPIAVGVAPNAGPYQLSFDASGIPKNTVLACDALRVVANGAPPSPTQEQTTRETLYTAVDALIDAAQEIDRAGADRTAAGDAMDAAVARFELVLDSGISGAARRNVSSAASKTRALARGVRGTKKPAAVLKSLRAIVTLAGKGAESLK